MCSVTGFKCMFFGWFKEKTETEDRSLFFLISTCLYNLQKTFLHPTTNLGKFKSLSEQNHFYTSVQKCVSMSVNFIVVKFADVFFEWAKLKHLGLNWLKTQRCVLLWSNICLKKKKNHTLKFSQIRFCEWKIIERHQLPFVSEFLLSPSVSSLPSDTDVCCTELQLWSCCYMQ